MQRLSLWRCSFSAISRGGWCLPLTMSWATCSNPVPRHRGGSRETGCSHGSGAFGSGSPCSRPMRKSGWPSRPGRRLPASVVYARPSMSRAIGLLLSGSSSSFTTATAIRSITPFPSIFPGLVLRWRSTPACASASRCATAASSAIVQAASSRYRRNYSSSGMVSVC